MFIADARTQARISALMQRVLIVDTQPASAKLLGELLRDICHCQIWTAADPAQGLAVAERCQPHLIFVGQCDGLDGARLHPQTAARRPRLPQGAGDHDQFGGDRRRHPRRPRRRRA